MEVVISTTKLIKGKDSHSPVSFQCYARQACCCVQAWLAIICYDTVWVEASHRHLSCDILKFQYGCSFQSVIRLKAKTILLVSAWEPEELLTFFCKWSTHILQVAYQCLPRRLHCSLTFCKRIFLHVQNTVLHKICNKFPYKNKLDILPVRNNYLH